MRGSTLPVQLSTFIGREREIMRITRLLQGTALLTLTGPGGCGKTRLALAVAESAVRRFPDGVWLVELAPYSDPRLAPLAVATALNLRESPGTPLIETLTEHLKSRHLLLLLDNCEHLIQSCAQLAHDLLTACPNLHILATSREPLHITGETTWLVPALALPDLKALPPVQELSQVEAVRVFVERARRTLPDFALDERTARPIAEICCQLAGSPLAIELAAARIRVLSPAQVAARLEDALTLLAGGDRTGPARHRTLQATLDWSYHLLAKPEQSQFRRLAVFTGSFALEAAEAVSACQEQALDLLAALVDKSLLEVEPETGSERRYRYLEPVRQYSLAKLASSGESEAARDRLLAWAVTLTRELSSYSVWYGHNNVKRLESDHSNLRAALAWSLTQPGRTEAGIRVATRLTQFWQMQGYITEGLDWLQRLMDRHEDIPDLLRVEALLRSGFLALHTGQVTLAKQYLELGLELNTQLGDQGDQSFLGWLIMFLGWAAFREGDMDEAEALCRQSLTIHQECRDALGIASDYLLLADLAYVGDHFESARENIEESLAICRRNSYAQAIGRRLARLGAIWLALDGHMQARECLDGSLRLCRVSGDHWGTVMALGGMVSLTRKQGLADRAAWLLGIIQVFLDRSGASLWPVDRMAYERNTSELRTLLGDAAFEGARGRGISQGTDDPDGAIRHVLSEPEPDEERRRAQAQRAGVQPAAAPAPGEPYSPLSRREREVAALVAQGKSNAEIAAALFLGLRTVEAHVTHILNKLGFNSRTQIAAWVVSQSLKNHR